MGASCDDKETSDEVNNPENQTEQNNSDNNSSTENGKVTEWKDGYITFYGQPDNNTISPHFRPKRCEHSFPQRVSTILCLTFFLCLVNYFSRQR